MPPKPPKDGKGLSAEEEAKRKAEAVDDIDNDEYKKIMRGECRELEKKRK